MSRKESVPRTNSNDIIRGEEMLKIVRERLRFRDNALIDAVSKYQQFMSYIENGTAEEAYFYYQLQI